MTAIDILSNLKIYQDLLNLIHQYELPKAMKKEGFVKLSKEIKSSYSFITLELNLVLKDSEKTEQHLYNRVTFELKNFVPVLKEVYSENKQDIPDIEKLIKDHQAIFNYNWQENPSESKLYDDKILNYLTIADSIAKQAINCAHGDDYRPGHFSQVKVNEECIVLSQVNHMNSRSLDHKENYSLRDLEFIIPLISAKLRTLFQDEKIGEMIVRFSDRSSANNKNCGDAIQKQIEIEKALFIRE